LRWATLLSVTKTINAHISAHPTVAFFVLAFAMSWTLMTPAMIAGLDSAAALPFFVGVFAPAAAAAIVTRVTGGSVRDWLRDIMRWRLPLRWYALAIGFPLALAVVASAEFALVGEELDFGLVGERAASFVPLFVFCLLVNGGPEEPAWRGFAIPRLQERFSPVRATLIFGPIWGIWHLPLLLAESNVDHDLATPAFLGMLLWTLAGFTAYAFTYTYLWNRTRSAFLCMVLHAAYNTAIGVAILRPADELVGSSYVAISLALTGTLWLAALGLIVATRGRLGLPSAAATASATRPLARRGPVPTLSAEPR
jgi:membrane protease YdiL (CAAX protease family)